MVRVKFVSYFFKIWNESLNILIFLVWINFEFGVFYFILWCKMIKKKEKKKEFILILVKNVLCLIRECVEYMLNERYL